MPTASRPPTARTQVRRLPNRADYDRQAIDAILDEALIAHVGFTAAHGPVVLPTTFVRVDDDVYLHGSAKNAMLLAASDAGAAMCMTVTIVDGIVLARSAFHHSINYRSVVVFGAVTVVREEAEARRALDALMEKVASGRSRDARPPTADELARTLVVRLPVGESSAKIRSGPPIDDDADLALPVWAGVVPVSMAYGKPVDAPDLATAIPAPVWER